MFELAAKSKATPRPLFSKWTFEFSPEIKLALLPKIIPSRPVKLKVEESPNLTRVGPSFLERAPYPPNLSESVPVGRVAPIEIAWPKPVLKLTFDL